MNEAEIKAKVRQAVYARIDESLDDWLGFMLSKPRVMQDINEKLEITPPETIFGDLCHFFYAQFRTRMQDEHPRYNQYEEMQDEIVKEVRDPGKLQ